MVLPEPIEPATGMMSLAAKTCRAVYSTGCGKVLESTSLPTVNARDACLRIVSMGTSRTALAGAVVVAWAEPEPLSVLDFPSSPGTCEV